MKAQRKEWFGADSRTVCNRDISTRIEWFQSDEPWADCLQEILRVPLKNKTIADD